MDFSPRSWQNLTVVLIVVGVLALALGGYLTPLSGTVLEPVLAIQNWISTRFIAFQDFFNAPGDIARLRQRNSELEAELANLQTEIVALQQQVVEIEILSGLVDFSRAQPGIETKAAAVIALDTSPFLRYVIINSGSDDGLRRGMPIVSAQGLVGRISAVTSNASLVQLITDPGSSINVRIQPAEADAVMLGSITGEISLDLISQDVFVEPGDLILTSGLGGNYPPNLLIGQVASVRQEATALFQTAAVQPVVDFSRLEIVLIIINFQPIDIEPLIPEDSPAP